MNSITSRILFLLILLLPAGRACAGDYTLVSSEKGIALYERWITISTGAQAREIMVVFFARTTKDHMLWVLQDPDKGKAWNRNVSDYRVLKEPAKTGWTTYIRYSAPWPVGDQDCCLAYTAGPDGTLYFNSTSEPQFPARGHVTRISGIKGKWIFQPQSNGQLKITYIITSDKSKSLPRWVTDPIIHKNMLKNISVLTTLLEKP